jgi:chromosome segregation ATPase
MIKKAIVSAAVLGIGAVTLLGTDVCSYSKTMFGNVREAVQAEIQPEFKLEDIRNQVDSLMPEIREHMKVVAEQVVDVRNMQAEISEKQSQLQNQKASILALRSDLDSNNSEFEYRQVSYTRNEVESDLSDRFGAFQLLEASADRDAKIMTATKEALKANQKKLDAMMSRKQDLAVKVSQAEARLKQIQATETVNAIEVDDTQLSHVEELLQRLNHDMDVREALLETEGHVLGRIPVEEVNVPETDVVSEIDQHFGLVESDKLGNLASAGGL